MPDRRPILEAPVANILGALAIGFAFGAALDPHVNRVATGIGTAIVMGVACSLVQRRGSRLWMVWLGAYAAVLVIGFVLALTGPIQ